MGTQRVTRARRRELEELAKHIRLKGQIECWSTDRIVDEILRELPEVKPLEAYRFAYGWTREQLSRALDLLSEQDGQGPGRVSSTEICGWEHGRHVPQSDRQDCLARVYRTRPDRLGFGRDHSPGARAADSEPEERVQDMVTTAQSDEAPPSAIVARNRIPAGPNGVGLTISVGPGLRITSLRLSGVGPDRDEVIIELEGNDMDRRTVIKLLGGLAITGLAPQIDLDHIASARVTPQHVDRGLIASLRGITNEYAQQRQAAGPAILLQPVLGHLGYLKALLEGVMPHATRTELASVLGETSVLAGWLSFLTENLGEARTHYDFAKQIAMEFDDRRLAAHALIAESALYFTTAYARLHQDTLTAVELLDRAAAVEPELPAPMRAWLACRQAEEYATLHRAEDSRRALDRAMQAVSEQAGSDEGGFFSSWTRARVAGYEGTCRLLLEDGAGAASVLEQAMAETNPSRVTALAGFQADLGGAYVLQGELAEGARLIGDAYEASARMGYALGMQRAVLMRARIGRWTNEPAVRELDLRLNAAP
jgi:transcriptional regulator with XRE-family HTH domain/tetratricopeptide (TPR) repeat protein